ncbi:hypothetical protein ACFV27_43240 [Streptomyces antimycoticus]|uniref:ESX-1 secretion-associated protein n=4 Tax=Streptomyces TaxID=1883 RepID=A0ABD5JJZ4_9ACTN|nr:MULTISPECIES: hypothetical protein [Streptomyces]MEE4588571.1 hypothetical protein [Streptomyces sp. DSM 41602]MCC4321091.1 hypothetical protein [Streptomyces malaysiensis]MCD9592815.1 hypothetical protein [Streptomyces sp. 8ZJF_21]MCM3812712.1 hypothetical protein [Streptomyces sp. DR7-3]UHH20524.1 hypothetical protein LUV23_32115 [Streptomyces sp. HNM0561]
MAPKLKVITDGIRSDAGMWDEQSGKLGGIHDTLEGFRINRIEAGLFQVLYSAYMDAIDQLSARTAEGKTRTKEVADALLKNAKAYDNHEVDTKKSVEDAY